MPSFNPSRPYVIAEIGANHNGDMALARNMIEVAKEIACDCVKFQSFDTKLFAREIYDEARFLGDDRDVESDLETAIKTYAVSHDDLEMLRDHCRTVGIDFASSAFEPDQAETLAELDAAFIKIASMDVNNDYLLRAVAGHGKRIVLSTGMATLDEIAHAVDTLEQAGCTDLVLLHCVSLYPAPADVINLANISMLGDTFGYPVGFSDHTEGVTIPLAAVALGAVMIEKHFTLDKAMEGWDHAISADPPEMKSLVAEAKRIYSALGTRRRVLSEDEASKRVVMRRSIVSARAIPAGRAITADDLTYRRPGSGLAPNLAPVLIGLKAARDIAEDTLVSIDDFVSAGS